MRKWREIAAVREAKAALIRHIKQGRLLIFRPISGGEIMRSNRPHYSATPAGSTRALDQKPKPKRSKREINQFMLLVFFVLLPVAGLLAIFFQPIRWVFMVLVLAALAAMWMLRAFLFPGRTILSAVYGLLIVFTLVTALTSSGGSNRIRQQNSFAMPTIAPTATPQFVYSTMPTSVPDDYYANTEDTLSATGQEEDALNTGSGVDGEELEGVYAPTVKSDAEIALENFMEKWRKAIIADMVEYTPKSWQNAQAESAQRQLFWKFAQRPLIDWRQMSAPSGTDASTARTITIQADISYAGETRTYEYEAITLYEDGTWYVDPDSLSTGVLKEQATPTPDPNLTPTPSPEPTPTPTPGPKTKLYYNKDGGKRYHADKECSSVERKYLPLSSFNYGDLSKSPYDKLVPCEVCGAPERP